MSVLKKVLKAGGEHVNFTRSMLVLGQLVVQRLQADAQKPRGTSAVASNLTKATKVPQPASWASVSRMLREHTMEPQTAESLGIRFIPDENNTTPPVLP